MDDSFTDELHGKAEKLGSKIVDYVFVPVRFLGGIGARFVQHLLSESSYGIAGFCLAMTGMALSWEAYLTSFGGFRPFLPKWLLNDGARFANLGAAWAQDWFMVLFLLFGAAIVQILESQCWRTSTTGKRKRPGFTREWWAWVGLVGAYVLDVYAVGTQYGKFGFSIPAIVWGVAALVLPEIGMALAQKGEK